MNDNEQAAREAFQGALRELLRHDNRLRPLLHDVAFEYDAAAARCDSVGNSWGAAVLADVAEKVRRMARTVEGS